jgi:hypothetical protein
MNTPDTHFVPIIGRPGWRRDPAGGEWYSARWLADPQIAPPPAMLDPAWTPELGYSHADRLLFILQSKGL